VGVLVYGMFLCFCDFVVVVFRMLFCVKISCSMAVLFFRCLTCSSRERVFTYALMATDVFQLLFASSFAAVFESACVTCTTSLTYCFCCAALGAGGIVKSR
jgi:hypothetical protein